MKIIKNLNCAATSSAITAARSIGTTFYYTDLDNVREVLRNNDLNIFAQYWLDQYGWEAINLKDNLFGSQIIDDLLYICVTDGSDMIINGEAVDPEFALEEYGVDACSAYIEPAPDDIITRYISEYEIDVADFEEAAMELLKGGYSFAELYKAAEDYNFDEM